MSVCASLFHFKYKFPPSILGSDGHRRGMTGTSPLSFSFFPCVINDNIDTIPRRHTTLQKDQYIESISYIT